jgi:predicted GIY-YIG superfamily endonuclease
MDCFKIDWTGYYSLNEAINRHEAKKMGVYAVYKPTTKKKSLWYFGKATNIGKRLDDHRKEWQQALSPVQMSKLQVAIGVVKSLEREKTSQPQLGYIESLFINEYKPERNDLSTKKGYKGKSVLIISAGKTGLFSKITTHDKNLLKQIKDNLVTKRNTANVSW